VIRALPCPAARVLLLVTASACGPGQPDIVTADLPAATATETYATWLAVEGGTAPLVWSLSDGELPEGLTLNPAGAISGVPDRSGATSFTLTVTDARGRTDQVSLDLDVGWGGGVLACEQEVSGSLAGGGVANWDIQPQVSEGVAWLQVPLPPADVSRIELVFNATNAFNTVVHVGLPGTRPGDTDLSRYGWSQYASSLGQPIVIDANSEPSLQALRAAGEPITVLMGTETATDYTVGSLCSKGPIFRELQFLPTRLGDTVTNNYNVWGDNEDVRIWTDDPLPDWLTWDESNGRLGGVAQETGVWSFTVQAQDADGYLREEQSWLAVYDLVPAACGETVQLDLEQAYYDGDLAYYYDPRGYDVVEVGIPLEASRIDVDVTGGQRPRLGFPEPDSEYVFYTPTTATGRDGSVSGGVGPRTSPDLDDYAQVQDMLYVVVSHNDYGASHTLEVSLTCDLAPRPAVAMLPVIEADSAGSTLLPVTGGTGPITWSADGLPQGVSLDPDGTLHHDRPARGTTPVSLILEDEAGAVSDTEYELYVGWDAACGGVEQLSCGERIEGTFSESLFTGTDPEDFRRPLCVPGWQLVDGFQLELNALDEARVVGPVRAPGQPLLGGDSDEILYAEQGSNTVAFGPDSAQRWQRLPLFIELTAYDPGPYTLELGCD